MKASVTGRSRTEAVELDEFYIKGRRSRDLRLICCQRTHSFCYPFGFCSLAASLLCKALFE